MDGCKGKTTLCPVIIHKNCARQRSTRGALQLARETYWNELLTTVLNRAKGVLIFTRKYTRRADLEPVQLKITPKNKTGTCIEVH